MLFNVPNVDLFVVMLVAKHKSQLETFGIQRSEKNDADTTMTNFLTVIKNVWAYEKYPFYIIIYIPIMYMLFLPDCSLLSCCLHVSIFF